MQLKSSPQLRVRAITCLSGGIKCLIKVLQITCDGGSVHLLGLCAGPTGIHRCGVGAGGASHPGLCARRNGRVELTLPLRC